MGARVDPRALVATGCAVYIALTSGPSRDPLSLRDPTPGGIAMFRSGLTCAVFSALAATAVAHAQVMPKSAPATPPPAAPAAPPANQPSPFDEIDTNHDGFISRDEYMAAQKKRFDEFDTNHDGKIDAKEIANSPPLMERNLRTAERMVKQWDSNADGVVTADEYKKFSEDRFARQDKEGTGKIPRRGPGPGMMMKPPGNQQIKPPLQPAPQPQPKPEKH
jgi:hypothetical protein